MKHILITSIALLVTAFAGCGGSGSSSGSVTATPTGQTGTLEAFSLEPWMNLSWMATIERASGSVGAYGAASANVAFITGPQVTSNVSQQGYAPIAWNNGLNAYVGWAKRAWPTYDGLHYWDQYRVYETASGLRVEIRLIETTSVDVPTVVSDYTGFGYCVLTVGAPAG